MINKIDLLNVNIHHRKRRIGPKFFHKGGGEGLLYYLQFEYSPYRSQEHFPLGHEGQLHNKHQLLF